MRLDISVLDVLGCVVPSREVDGADMSMELAIAASRIGRGDTAWFWGTERGPDGAPTLLLESTREDPTGESLGARVSSLAPHLGLMRKDHTGVVHVAPTGALCFRSHTSGDELLHFLARLVRSNLHTWPELSRLVGARHTRPNARGSRETTRRDDLWSTCLPPDVSPEAWTLMQSTGTELRRAAAGDELSFWLHTGSPMGSVLVVRRTHGHEKHGAREAFLGDVARLRHEMGFGTGRLGIWTVRPDGRLDGTTHGDIEALATELSTFITDNAPFCPELARIGSSTLRNRHGSNEATTVPSRVPPMPADIAVQLHLTASLATLHATGEAYFWFTPRAHNTAPILALTPPSQGLDGLRAEVHTIKGPRPALASPTGGRVLLQDDGRLMFQSKAESPRFIQDLAAFYRAHVGRIPSLRVLENARFLSGDSPPQDDPSLWVVRET